jgi:hypothetical protein
MKFQVLLLVIKLCSRFGWWFCRVKKMKRSRSDDDNEHNVKNETVAQEGTVQSDVEKQLLADLVLARDSLEKVGCGFVSCSCF